jgi:hypothetical protein
MAFTDRTNEFRSTWKEHHRVLPDAKRQKLAKVVNHDHGQDGTVDLGKEYIAEAYIIVRGRSEIPPFIK